jgi:hypothetical protein
LAKEFKGEIPIVTDIPKGKTSCSIHYRSDSEIMEIAEKLVYKRTGKFASPSEVLRASTYIGICVIWSLFENSGEKSPYGEAMFERMKQREELTNASIAIREFLKDVDAIYLAAEEGIISYDERSEKTNKLISSLPANLKDVARERLKRYEAGEKISQIHDFKSHGGVRK